MPLRLITEGEFRSSRYGQVADQIEGRLADIIEQAENHIEDIVQRTLSVTAHTETVGTRTRTSLYLREFPIVAVTAIEGRLSPTQAWTALDVSAFEVDERLAILTSSAYDLGYYPEIRVRYSAGYDPVPPLIKMAVILQTAYFAYQDFEMYGTGDAKEPGIRYVQKDIKEYLKPYTRARMI